MGCAVKTWRWCSFTVIKHCILWLVYVKSEVAVLRIKLEFFQSYTWLAKTPPWFVYQRCNRTQINIMKYDPYLLRSLAAVAQQVLEHTQASTMMMIPSATNAPMPIPTISRTAKQATVLGRQVWLIRDPISNCCRDSWCHELRNLPHPFGLPSEWCNIYEHLRFEPRMLISNFPQTQLTIIAL